MGNEFDKIKSYFLFALLIPIIFYFIFKLTFLFAAFVIVGEIAMFVIYKDRLKHFKFVYEKDKAEKAKVEYIISRREISNVPNDVKIYEYKFTDYSTHDIFNKQEEKKRTLYKVDKKYCYVYYMEKGKILEVKRKAAYETKLKQNFKRHENRGSYEEW